MPRTKLVALTAAEAELLLDSHPVRNPQTRSLALKLAGVVLEFESDVALDAVAEILATARTAAVLPAMAPIAPAARAAPAKVPAVYSFGHALD